MTDQEIKNSPLVRALESICILVEPHLSKEEVKRFNELLGDLAVQLALAIQHIVTDKMRRRSIRGPCHTRSAS